VHEFEALEIMQQYFPAITMAALVHSLAGNSVCTDAKS
jgi:hypothetical protein